MSDDDLIRRGDVLALFENYTGAQFWVQQITALPADDRVAKLVVAAKAALQWLDDDLGASSEAQPERQNLRSALSALEAGE
jgi:hypothetical protein